LRRCVVAAFESQDVCGAIFVGRVCRTQVDVDVR
jgi:hypothetical protein